MARTPTHYEILHVQPDAPHEIVHMSYLTLMRRLRMHPDLGGDPDRAARINEAFAVLSDPAARARYDLSLGGAPPPIAIASTMDVLPARSPKPVPGGTLVTACEFCGTLHAAGDLTRQDAVCARCDSPLHPAVLHEADESTRRAFHRVSREWPLAFHATFPYGAPHIGTTRDLSISGLRFATDSHLEVGQRLRVSCAFCDAVGDVRHVHAEQHDASASWLVGVAFLTLRVNLAAGGILSRRL